MILCSPFLLGSRTSCAARRSLELRFFGDFQNSQFLKSIIFFFISAIGTSSFGCSCLWRIASFSQIERAGLVSVRRQVGRVGLLRVISGRGSAIVRPTCFFGYDRSGRCRSFRDETPHRSETFYAQRTLRTIDIFMLCRPCCFQQSYH